MKQNKRIAITGGIGSGKSALLAVFREMGYPVVSCDDISHRLWEDEAYRAEIAKLFPSCVLNGTLNKQVLSALVFSDPISREKLNRFSHPYIMQRLLNAMTGELCFAEVPLLYEGGYETLFDGVIAVRRADEKRISSVQERSRLSREQVLERMKSQFPPQRLEEKNCILIENDGSLADLEQQAKRAIKQLCE